MKIFDEDHNHLISIGDVGQCGSNNDQFCWPIGITVDQFDNVFVADVGNARFQKFDKDYQWIMTLGTVGSWGNSFFEFSNPEGVAVDTEGRIYAVDMWGNMRVQVYDEVGAYLTTLGGEWGESSSQFRGISSASLNSAGDVFVSDFYNGRIQIFAPGVPDWTQVNINGFGHPSRNGVLSLEEFNGYLYAGTRDNENGGQIWRSVDGVHWSPASEPGLSEE